MIEQGSPSIAAPPTPARPAARDKALIPPADAAVDEAAIDDLLVDWLEVESVLPNSALIAVEVFFRTGETASTADVTRALTVAGWRDLVDSDMDALLTNCANAHPTKDGRWRWTAGPIEMLLSPTEAETERERLAVKLPHYTTLAADTQEPSLSAMWKEPNEPSSKIRQAALQAFSSFTPGRFRTLVDLWEQEQGILGTQISALARQLAREVTADAENQIFTEQSRTRRRRLVRAEACQTTQRTLDELVLDGQFLYLTPGADQLVRQDMRAAVRDISAASWIRGTALAAGMAWTPSARSFIAWTWQHRLRIFIVKGDELAEWAAALGSEDSEALQWEHFSYAPQAALTPRKASVGRFFASMMRVIKAKPNTSNRQPPSYQSSGTRAFTSAASTHAAGRRVRYRPAIVLTTDGETTSGYPGVSLFTGKREFHGSWTVRGHIRNQWFPSEQTHRPVWIESYDKGHGSPLPMAVTVSIIRAPAEM